MLVGGNENAQLELFVERAIVNGDGPVTLN
jgi:hypothetical protein